MKRNNKHINSLPNVKLGDVRTITKAFSQMLVILIVKEPIKTKKLLQIHGVQLADKPSEKDVINGIITKVADQDPLFNHDLALLIEMVLPDLPQEEQYDNFGESPFKFGGDTRLFGESGGSAVFGGDAGLGSSSGSNFLDGAKSIGSSTASGAAGGGVLGGIIGAVGGIFNYSSTVKQQKIQQEEAASKVFSDLLQFKRGSGNGGNSKTGTYLLVGVTMLVLIGIILAAANNRNKKATS